MLVKVFADKTCDSGEQDRFRITFDDQYGPGEEQVCFRYIEESFKKLIIRSA